MQFEKFRKAVSGKNLTTLPLSQTSGILFMILIWLVLFGRNQPI